VGRRKWRRIIYHPFVAGVVYEATLLVKKYKNITKGDNANRGQHVYPLIEDDLQALLQGNDKVNFEELRLNKKLGEIAKKMLTIEEDGKGKTKKEKTTKRKWVLESSVGWEYKEAIEKEKSILVGALKNKIRIEK